MTSETMTLTEWYDHLIRHDWTYMYSDDHKAWLKGEKSHAVIHHVLDYYDDPTYRDMYDRYILWVNDIEGDIDKPRRPE